MADRNTRLTVDSLGDVMFDGFNLGASADWDALGMLEFDNKVAEIVADAIAHGRELEREELSQGKKHGDVKLIQVLPPPVDWFEYKRWLVGTLAATDRLISTHLGHWEEILDYAERIVQQMQSDPRFNPELQEPKPCQPTPNPNDEIPDGSILFIVLSSSNPNHCYANICYTPRSFPVYAKNQRSGEIVKILGMKFSDYAESVGLTLDRGCEGTEIGSLEPHDALEILRP